MQYSFKLVFRFPNNFIQWYKCLSSPSSVKKRWYVGLHLFVCRKIRRPLVFVQYIENSLNNNHASWYDGYLKERRRPKDFEVNMLKDNVTGVCYRIFFRHYMLETLWPTIMHIGKVATCERKRTLLVLRSKVNVTWAYSTNIYMVGRVLLLSPNQLT